jgi:hypothetical protein
MNYVNNSFYCKKHAVLVLLSIFFLVGFGCKKNDDISVSTGDYFIKASLNGKFTEYKSSAEGRVENTSFRATAFSTASSNFPSFNFDIEGSPIEIKTYTESNARLIFRYNLSGFENFNSNMGNEVDFKITITELTGEIVSGTFEGTIRKAQNFEESISINNGEFRLKRVS